MFDGLKKSLSAPGTVTIQLEKNSYGFGEKVKGKATLVVNDTRNAKGVRVSVIGTRDHYVYRNNRRERETETIHKFEKYLDGEKAYVPGTYSYDFEADTPPSDPCMGSSRGGLFGGLMNVAGGYSTPVWTLTVSLDVSGGKDAQASVQVSLQGQGSGGWDANSSVSQNTPAASAGGGWDQDQPSASAQPDAMGGVPTKNDPKGGWD